MWRAAHQDDPERSGCGGRETLDINTGPWQLGGIRATRFKVSRWKLHGQLEHDSLSKVKKKKKKSGWMQGIESCVSMDEWESSGRYPSIRYRTQSTRHYGVTCRHSHANRHSANVRLHTTQSTCLQLLPECLFNFSKEPRVHPRQHFKPKCGCFRGLFYLSVSTL
jgi:hypothetical protein